MLKTPGRLGGKLVWATKLKILTLTKNMVQDAEVDRQEGRLACCTCWLAQLVHAHNDDLSICIVNYDLPRQ